MKKLKKILVSFLGLLTLLGTKVMGIRLDEYATLNQSLYGVEAIVSKSDIIIRNIRVLGIILVPIIIIIGIVEYVKERKKYEEKKDNKRGESWNESPLYYILYYSHRYKFRHKI